MSERRIYLDNAATSFPKPEAVYAAVERYQREIGVAVGRGATRAGSEVQWVIDHTRLQAARMFGAARPEQVIFTLNGTDALNLAIQGILNDGDRAVTTVWDHNSVLRPLKALEKHRNVESEVIGSDGAGGIDQEALEKSLRKPTRLVIVTHASNVTGVIQPIEEISRIAHAAGALVLLDAAQTAGHISCDFNQLGVDLIACPGHKGLMGPLGTGLLVLGPHFNETLRPLRFGGTGTSSESEFQPDALPERYESGNHNAPGLVGLAAALDWHQANKTRENGQSSHASSLFKQLASGLEELPHVTVHCCEGDASRVGLVSLSVDRMSPQVLASLLDEHFGIETRAGLHCAPQAHGTLGTLEQGGTLRLSWGPFNSSEDMDATLEALGQIVMAI